MLLTVNGSCSGMEPMPGMQHVSFTLTSGGSVYWFDAGEGCSRTAYLNGTDLLATKAVFISHTHMDHVGGMANLFWNIRKVASVKRAERPDAMKGKNINLFIPEIETWLGIQQILRHSEGGFATDFTIEASPYSDGAVYADENISVYARHNLHLQPIEPGDVWRSYSFRIESEGKSLVYSGDVKHISEIVDWLPDADLVLFETGHHKVEQVCEYFLENGSGSARLGFIHHGREIVADRSAALLRARGILGDRVFFTEDGMKITV